MEVTRGKGGNPGLPLEMAQQAVEAVNEALEDGYPLKSLGRHPSATSIAAERLGIAYNTMCTRLKAAARKFGLEPDPARYREPPKVEPQPKRAPPPFTIDGLPDDGEPDAEDLIAMLSARHEKRKAHADAAKLLQVRVNIDGPIGLAFFGDPHVDDPGCAWSDLERDVRICRETEGVLACDVGDDSNNWVGRLMRLYADQEVTAKQSLKLIEWLMLSLPWLIRVKGNHDVYNTDKGDVADYIHRLGRQFGALESHGARMQLTLPGGASFFLHVRHDFPGGSQFNPAHALVRETLFGYRDHIMACGHRHTTGYMPIWHNDPRRLCHGFRVGTYKDFDKYAAEKHFQDGNWARAMGAVVDPAYAGDPVRFIRPAFSVEELADLLTWSRRKWEQGKTYAA